MTPTLVAALVVIASGVGLVGGAALMLRTIVIQSDPATLDRLAKAEADAERWKAEATTYYPPDGSGPIILPITDVRVRLAEDARRLAAAEAENKLLRVRVAELESGVGPVAIQHMGGPDAGPQGS